MGTRSQRERAALRAVPPEGGAEGRSADVGDDRAPRARSLDIAGGGIRTGEDFANLMAALMADVIDGTVSPNVANATVAAGRQLLKVVEMRYRYAPNEATIPLSPGIRRG